ncbi:glycosyltransferase [Zunongwangia endophytica]|uniref:Glycosyltransferase n=1 Tax=Zunongwangia endophytica TaxID=1808945 RepID=A0ABV8H5T6_9FLAO|nr:glycosyltransferase [Zunongwangia endophytica]MDN3595038.1 glycosyltransferase [Zunongwangia endophytica]
MKILIVTPFFDNLGGSELETIHTANYISELSHVSKVFIFSNENPNYKFLEGIEISNKIEFISYPYIIRTTFLKKWNAKYLYWKLVYFFKQIDFVYIITKNTQDFYYPIIKSFFNKKKIIIKYTTIRYIQLSPLHISLLNSVNQNLVTSENQVDYFIRQGINNISCNEVLTFSESILLGQSPCKIYKYDFGVISRISPEKQLEDTIYLISELKARGLRKRLIIIGTGEISYRNFLISEVSRLKLNDLVDFDFNEIPYDVVHTKFSLFKIFLITSSYEGGPNIALELMAAAKVILTYNVGAMPIRLGKFEFLVTSNFHGLILNSIYLLSLPDEMFLKLSNDIRSEYLMKFRNEFTEDYLKSKLI